MAHVDFQRRIVRFHVLFWGCQGSGILESLRHLHLKTPESERGPLQVIRTEVGLVACFHYRPALAGRIRGYRSAFFFTGCPVSPRYLGTRNFVFDLADGIVFAAQADESVVEDTVALWKDLGSELKARDLVPAEFPVILQWNSPDKGGKASPNFDAFTRRIDPHGAYPSFRANPATGRGLIPVMDTICLLTSEKFRATYDPEGTGPDLETVFHGRGSPGGRAPPGEKEDPGEALKSLIEHDHSGTAIWSASRPAQGPDASGGRSSYYLDVFLQGAPLQLAELPRVGQFTIGRSKGCDLVLDDPSIHNCQGALVISDYGVFLQCNYPEEVWINSGKAGSGAWLREGDRIQVGKYFLHVKKRRKRGT